MARPHARTAFAVLDVAISPVDHLGEAAPWPFVSQARRRYRRGRRVALFLGTVTVGLVVISYVGEWAARGVA